MLGGYADILSFGFIMLLTAFLKCAQIPKLHSLQRYRSRQLSEFKKCVTFIYIKNEKGNLFQMELDFWLVQNYISYVGRRRA